MKRHMTQKIINPDLFPEDGHHLAGHINTHYHKFQ